MKNYCFFLSVVASFILSGCNLTQGKEDIGELKPTLPSAKEFAMNDSLKKVGFSNIKLDIPIPGYTGTGNAFYCIEMKAPFIYTSNKKDSIRLVAHAIANKLYSQIIEDSIIFQFRSIEITFNLKSLDKHKKKDITYSYEKEELELKNCFKVIEEYNTGNYKRISWTQKDYYNAKILQKQDEEKRIQRIIERNDSIQNRKK